MSIEFWVTTVVLTLTPGPGVLFTLSAALSRGLRAGLVAAAGCTLGLVPHALAAASGAALLLAASPTAFAVLRWAGVGYLLLMAWTTLRHGLPLDAERRATVATDDPRVVRTVVEAVLLNLLNPKLTMFFFVFLPQFVPAGSPHSARLMLVMSLAIMVVTLLVFAGYAVAAASVQGAVARRPAVSTWVRRGLSLSFVALGARLAMSVR